METKLKFEKIIFDEIDYEECPSVFTKRAANECLKLLLLEKIKLLEIFLDDETEDNQFEITLTHDRNIIYNKIVELQNEYNLIK